MFGLSFLRPKRPTEPCLLAIQRVTVNTNEISPKSKVFHLFNRAIEVAAFEYLAPLGVIPTLDNFAPECIHLMINLEKDAGRDWEILIQARGTGSVLVSNISWPESDTQDPGEVYHALEHHLRPIIEGLARNHSVDPKGFFIVRADLRTVSAHKRLQMLPSRTDILKAYADRDKA